MPISQASADQRAGRAGRVRSGLSFFTRKFLDYIRENLTTCQRDVFATGLQQACQQVVTMLLFYQAVTRLSLTNC